MASSSLPYKNAKTGSNARGKSLPDGHQRAFHDLVKPIARLSREHQRALRRLLSKADLRKAAAIAADARRALHTANLDLGPSSGKWDVNKETIRRRCARSLARAIPRFSECQKRAREHQRELSRLASRADQNLHLRLGDVLPADSGETFEFTPPYAIYDVHQEEDDDVEVQDRSFAVPSIGHIVNDLSFAQKFEPLVITDIYGINWFGRHFSTAACGVNFTTPASGRLRVQATLRNFHNRVTTAVRDCFGFSQAILRVHLRLWLAVAQPNRLTEFRRTLYVDGLDSFGADLSYPFPTLDTETPYTFEATTDETFTAGAGLQILAGTEVFILSEIDDMESFADVLLWSQLQKIAVNLV